MSFCRACGQTKITIQTERRCAFQPPMTSTAQPRALGAFGFAAYMRSGFEFGDEEMVAAKLEKLGNRIEALEGALADIMQYDLSDILPFGLILRMNETEVTI